MTTLHLRLYDHDGTTLLGLLPTPHTWTAGVEFSDVGGFTLEYPAGGVNADLLDELREIALVDDTGAEVANGRYVIVGMQRNRLAADVVQVQCKSLLWRLDTALVYPDGGLLSGETSRLFDTVTAGSIITTLVDDAHTRGALAGITIDGTALADAAGHAWSETTTVELSARDSVLSALRSLIDKQLVEVTVQGRTLRLFNPDGVGTDRTTGASPVVLRHGQSLTEAPEQTSADRVAGVLLVEGDEGVLVERVNTAAVSTYGRLESSATAAGVADEITVAAIGDAVLETVGAASRQLTVGLAVQSGVPMPLVDFHVGDWVYTATTAGLESVRVRQITVTRENSGSMSATAVLGDRLLEADVRLARKVAQITNGSIPVGSGTPTSTPTVGTDDIAPMPPTAVSGTASTYLDGGDAVAQVVLTWTAPIKNADNTTLTDLRGYDVLYRIGAGTYTPLGSVTELTATVRNLPVSTTLGFIVRAFDAFGNRSTNSTEYTVTTGTYTTPTAIPSTPSVSSRLGTITVVWDGKDTTGAVMPANFSHVEVHVSTTSGFTPSLSTLRGRMNGADTLVLADLTYGTTYYVVLVAYTKTGVASSKSGQVSASVSRLVDTDIVANTLSTWPFAGQVVSASALADGSVSASKLLDGAVNASKLLDGSVSALKIADGAVQAAKLAANAVTSGAIAQGAVSELALAANAVTAAKIAAGAVGSNQISAGAITAGKIAAGSIAAGDIAAGAITTAKLVAGAVTATELAAGAVTAGKISAGAVTATEIAAGSITSAKIVAGAIGATEIAANAITAAKISAGAIGADQIAAGAIIAGKIGADAITASNIQAGAISADKIAANAITADKINAGAIDGKLITGAQIQTAASGARIVLTSAGLTAYNGSGSQTFNISGSTGAVTIGGYATQSSLDTVSTTASNAASTASSASSTASSAYTTASNAATAAANAQTTANGKISAGGAAADINANTTTISGGKITTGTLSADTISGGTISTSSLYILDSARYVQIGQQTETAFLRVNPLSVNGVALNGVGFTSTTYGGVISNWFPYYDNTVNCGLLSYRWKYLYAATGTVQTSDMREKHEIADSALGLDFIKSLRPVSYKWIVGGNEYDVDANGDKVFDDNGVLKAHPVAGKRTHWGFLAQEVKQAVDASGVDDFAGWVLGDIEDPDSVQALRYDEFIAPLTKAVQELAAANDALQARVALLEGRAS